MIALLLLGLLLFVVAILPNILVKYVIKKHHINLSDIPGTGLELLEFLIKQHVKSNKLQSIAYQPIIKIADNNFYDPATKSIVIDEQVANNKSISAVAIATHEFCHYLQHYNKETLFIWRQKLFKISQVAQTIARYTIILSPLTLVIGRNPIISFIVIGGGIMLMFIPVMVHFITLKVEFDASFNKAMPILSKGIIDKKYLPKIKIVLRVCAYTYMAATLANLFNFISWFRTPFRIK